MLPPGVQFCGFHGPGAVPRAAISTANRTWGRSVGISWGAQPHRGHRASPRRSSDRPSPARPEPRATPRPGAPRSSRSTAGVRRPMGHGLGTRCPSTVFGPPNRRGVSYHPGGAPGPDSGLPEPDRRCRSARMMRSIVVADPGSAKREGVCLGWRKRPTMSCFSAGATPPGPSWRKRSSTGLGGGVFAGVAPAVIRAVRCIRRRSACCAL
jgi:hypothetical protein